MTVVKALTEEDWRAVNLAHQAFIYQVRRIVAEAEALNEKLQPSDR